MEILTIVISVFASIVSGTVLFFLQRHFKKIDKRDKLTALENILILKSINSIGKLTYANAIAIQKGHNNGEMKEAMDGYAEVNDELYEYLLEQNAHK
ncbi:MAG: hypothetical protein PHE12_02550 [Clostridia bacterium]|nr:hypothetical protein [Clostridia bacterium]